MTPKLHILQLWKARSKFEARLKVCLRPFLAFSLSVSKEVPCRLVHKSPVSLVPAQQSQNIHYSHHRYCSVLKIVIQSLMHLFAEIAVLHVLPYLYMSTDSSQPSPSSSSGAAYSNVPAMSQAGTGLRPPHYRNPELTCLVSYAMYCKPYRFSTS